MMKMVVCSIYDKATEAYMRPFFAATTAQAVRMFIDDVNRPDSESGAHPEDYALFHIANFTDNDGMISPLEPKCLARAHEIKDN